MKRCLGIWLIFVLFMSGCNLFVPPAEQVNLFPLFSDHMVFQQNQPIVVWGTAGNAGQVTVELAGKSASSRADDNGRWRVELDAMPAGGPFELTVKGQETQSLRDVMIGEVWVCSGQSNMEWPVSRANHAEQEIAAARYDNLRLFTVKKNTSATLIDTIDTDGWQRCTPETVPGFSAVGYFFGRHLIQNLDVTVGLIHTSWGGTPSEAWTSGGSLQELPQFSKLFSDSGMTSASQARLDSIFQKALAEWAVAVDKKIDNEMGDESQAWQERSFDDSEWTPMILPTLWEESGLANYDGLVLFRKTIDLPDDWAGQKVVLELGKIDDQDITWFNGVKVGNTQRHDQKRVYSVPRQLVRGGKNVIAVQVNDTGGGGGLYGPEEWMWLKSDDQNPVSVSGPWKYKAIAHRRDLPRVPSMTRSQNTPTFLYNAMIHPLLQFPVQGAIWYQGESNASRAQEYRTLFPLMIRDWRKSWQDDSLDFYFVQLANFKERNLQPVESDWAELREAQALALDLPLTGMAVTIDIGQADDIHPRNKQDVGKRLALNALHTTYDQDIVPSGPIYRDMKIEGSEIHLSFDHVAKGLVTPANEPLLGFSIAGQDRRFVWADAHIQGEKVVVSSPQVAEPLAVRYAWSDNPACNLYNSANLPALPFRTDDWPGITRDRVWGQ